MNTTPKTIIVPVHLFAFGKGEIRNVSVPADEFVDINSTNALLDLVFRYGQNDFQSLPLVSISVGDIAEISVSGKDETELWIIMAFEWKRITIEQFEAYKAMNRNEQWQFAYKGRDLI